MTRFLFILTVLLAVTSCSNPTGYKSTTNNPVNTANSFKVGSYWLTPKKSFDFNSVGKSSIDTLHLVTCSSYIYFPFGKLTDKSSLNASLLKNFNIISSKLDTFTNIMMPSDTSDNFKQWSETIELELGPNKLSLFLDNDPESSKHGYIRGGQIMDSKVLFLNDIKVGMGIEAFCKKFFDYFPTALSKKFKVVKLESCVADVTHISTFNNGLLRSVIFINQ